MGFTASGILIAVGLLIAAVFGLGAGRAPAEKQRYWRRLALFGAALALVGAVRIAHLLGVPDVS